MTFRDRRDAGRKLGEALQSYRDAAPVIVGLVRGGVPVADEVAKALDAPLDVLIVRKLGAPHNPEYGIGAVAEGTRGVVSVQDLEMLGVTREELTEIVQREREEIHRRQEMLRGDYPALDVEGGTVIIVDDGLATGVTASVAIKSMREREARQVVLAAPVGAAATIEQMQQEADAVVCLETPAEFRAVGAWYEHFGPTTDEEVLEILASSRA